MVIMSIEVLRYIENENHTIKYKNTMERYVGTSNQNKIWSKEFPNICAESFEDCLLDHPHYTKPPEFEGRTVPEVLMSGHHANIEKFRLSERIRMTQNHRPDLYDEYLKRKKK